MVSRMLNYDSFEGLISNQRCCITSKWPAEDCKQSSQPGW